MYPVAVWINLGLERAFRLPLEKSVGVLSLMIIVVKQLWNHSNN